MRLEFQIALICAVAAIPAGVAMIEAPEYFPVLKAYRGTFFYGSSIITIILLGAALLIAIRGERDAEREGAKKRMIPFIGMIIFGASFLGCAAWYFWPGAATGSPDDSPLELHEHFETDFVARGNGGAGLSLNGYSLVPLSNGKDLKLEWRVMTDFGSHSRFLVYYIPESAMASYEVAKFIAEEYKSQLDAFETTVRTAADHAAKSSAALKFTGRIFVYHEGDMTDAQRTELIALYKANGLEPEFRSRSYPLAVFDAAQRSSATPRKRD